MVLKEPKKNPFPPPLFERQVISGNWSAETLQQYPPITKIAAKIEKDMELVDHRFKLEQLFIKNHLFSVSAICLLVGAVTAKKEIGSHLILLTTSLWISA